MQELIKITEKDGQQLVSGKELHNFLEVGRDFSTWIKARIKKYEFVENTDFTIITTTPQNGGIAKDYIITVDMAKQLSMVENNEKGNQARKYFIQCEKKLREVVQDPYKALSPELQAIFKIDQKQQALEEKVEDMESNFPLFNIECEELQKLVKKVGTNALGGYGSRAYKDNSLRQKVYKDIQHQLTREFGIGSYKAIKRCQLPLAKEIVQAYRIPTFLQNQVIALNNQIEMEDI